MQAIARPRREKQYANNSYTEQMHIKVPRAAQGSSKKAHAGPELITEIPEKAHYFWRPNPRGGRIPNLLRAENIDRFRQSPTPPSAKHFKPPRQPLGTGDGPATIGIRRWNSNDWDPATEQQRLGSGDGPTIIGIRRRTNNDWDPATFQFPRSKAF